MIKRLLAGSVCLTALMLTLSACGSKHATPPPLSQANTPQPVPAFPAGSTMDTIQKRGKIIIGVNSDQPGFGLKEPTTGQYQGFDIEMADLIAQGTFGGTAADAHQKIQFVEAVSQNREPFIQNGTVDLVIAAYPITDVRKQVIDFAGPYFMNHGDMMVMSDNTTIRSVSDLNGKRVCVKSDSAYRAVLATKAPLATVTPLDTYGKCTDALKSGTVDAVVTDQVILSGLVTASGGAYKLVNSPITDEPYGMGLKKGDDGFREFLNTRIETIETNGDWANAYADTLGKLGLATPTPPAVNRYPATGTSTTTTTAAAQTSTTG